MESEQPSFWRKNGAIIVAGLVPLISIGASVAKDSLNGNYIALSVGLIGVATFAMVFFQLELIARENEARLRRVAQEFNDQLNGAKLRVYNSPKHALEYFSENVPKMRKVRNTSVCALDQVDHVKRQYTDQGWYNEYITSVLDPLKAGRLHYQDILTPGIAQIENHRSVLLKKESLEPFYCVRELSSDVKFTEFTIVSYLDNRPSEVLFGWDHGVAGCNPVFCSNQIELVNYFEELFTYLWERAALKLEING